MRDGRAHTFARFFRHSVHAVGVTTPWPLLLFESCCAAPSGPARPPPPLAPPDTEAPVEDVDDAGCGGTERREGPEADDDGRDSSPGWPPEPEAECGPLVSSITGVDGRRCVVSVRVICALRRAAGFRGSDWMRWAAEGRRGTFCGWGFSLEVPRVSFCWEVSARGVSARLRSSSCVGTIRRIVACSCCLVVLVGGPKRDPPRPLARRLSGQLILASVCRGKARRRRAHGTKANAAWSALPRPCPEMAPTMAGRGTQRSPGERRKNGKALAMG